MKHHLPEPGTLISWTLCFLPTPQLTLTPCWVFRPQGTSALSAEGLALQINRHLMLPCSAVLTQTTAWRAWVWRPERLRLESRAVGGSDKQFPPAKWEQGKRLYPDTGAACPPLIIGLVKFLFSVRTLENRSGEWRM